MCLSAVQDCNIETCNEALCKGCSQVFSLDGCGDTDSGEAHLRRPLVLCLTAFVCHLPVIPSWLCLLVAATLEVPFSSASVTIGHLSWP